MVTFFRGIIIIPSNTYINFHVTYSLLIRKKITEKNKERYLKEKDELIKKKMQLLKYNIP